MHALIVQLADVESDFQLEDLIFLVKNWMRSTRNLNFTLDQLKNLIDFVLSAEPLMKTTVPQLIFYLENLEQQGLFRLLNAGINTVSRIGARYSDTQIQQMSDGIVRYMDVLKK